MFIETLEFTIPVDLCDLFSTLKKGPKANMEFPASVNSYGTTQDANIQVVLRSNKLTFKVDGVSSDASMISKSECKNLKLSIFDVDRSLMPQEEVYEEMPAMIETPISAKRARDYSSTPVRSPPVKSSRTSYSESPRNTSTSNRQQNQNNSHPSNQSQSRPSNDNSLNVKQEPEDPDCIEIEPDPEPDIVPKKESNYYSSCSGDIPHTQTSQSALERLSHPHSSHSQSPASSSSSFHHNVPHVQDYSEPGPSQMHHGDQSADDFLVFQEQDDNEDCDNDNEADFDNDGVTGSLSVRKAQHPSYFSSDSARYPALPPHHPLQDPHYPPQDPHHPSHDPHYPSQDPHYPSQDPHYPSQEPATDPSLDPMVSGGYGGDSGKLFQCPHCFKTFSKSWELNYHIKAIHENVTFKCDCGKTYKYQTALSNHQKKCPIYLLKNS